MRRDNERGSTTIENMVWLPIILMILAAIVQFGLYFNARNAVQTASYEATRRAIVASDPNAAAASAVYGFANGTMPGWQQGGRVSYTLSAPNGYSPGQEITVTVSYNVPMFMTGLIPNSSALAIVNGKSTMRIDERP